LQQVKHQKIELTFEALLKKTNTISVNSI